MITNNYYAIALDDYQVLKDLAPLKRYNHVAVLSEQVVEKMLKFIVYTFCAGKEEAEVALNKHNLKKLYLVIINSGINLELDKKDLTYLEDFYFDTRYPGDNFMSVTENDAKECVNIVESIKPKVENFLRENMYCTNCGTRLLSSGECPNLKCNMLGDGGLAK